MYHEKNPITNKNCSNWELFYDRSNDNEDYISGTDYFVNNLGIVKKNPKEIEKAIRNLDIKEYFDTRKEHLQKYLNIDYNPDVYELIKKIMAEQINFN